METQNVDRIRIIFKPSTDGNFLNISIKLLLGRGQYRILSWSNTKWNHRIKKQK